MFLDKSLNWLSPRVCLCCGKRLRLGSLCQLCAPPEQIGSGDERCGKCFCPFLAGSTHCNRCIHLPFSKMRFLWSYEQSVRDCISAIKYQPNERLLRVLLMEVPSARLRLFPGRRWDIVVPIPSRIVSNIRRGFFGTKEIANSFLSSLSYRYRPPISSSALRLKRSHPPQALIEPTLRRKNVANTLIASTMRVQGKRVLLVDDVITTGATIEEACRAILSENAVSVDVFALARADTWLRFHQSIDPVPGRGLSHEP